MRRPINRQATKNPASAGFFAHPATARLERQFATQVGDFRAAAIENQLVGTLGVETLQADDHLLQALGFVAQVAGHAEVIPGFAMHGLQTHGFFQRLGCLGVASEAGLSHRQTVPGTIESRLGLYGLREGDAGFGGAAASAAFRSASAAATFGWSSLWIVSMSGLLAMLFSVMCGTVS